MLYGLAAPTVMPALQAVAGFGSEALPELWGVSSVLMVIVFVEAIVLLLYAVERKRLQRRDKLAAEGE